MQDFLHHFVIGAAGAAAFEALKLWELQGKITEGKFKKLLGSLSLWIPLTLMLAASGFLAWAFYEGKSEVKAWNLVVVGITVRTLVREVTSAGFAHSKIKLGGSDRKEETAGVRDFFQ